MIDLLEVARALQEFCLARVTRDVNLTPLTGFGQESFFIDSLLSQYRCRVADATEFALRSRDLDLRTCSAEDLLVMKLSASRAIDIRDAEGIAIRHKKRSTGATLKSNSPLGATLSHP